MILSIIVAFHKDKHGNMIIGKDNSIPWHVPHDLIRFKEHTTGHAIIMGRKTHESIGRVLPGRDNIVITGQQLYESPGTHIFHDVDPAIKFAVQNSCESFIIGGEDIYVQTLDRVDRLYITHIHTDIPIQGDSYFPRWERSSFKSIHCEKRNGRTDFEILERTGKPKHPLDNSAISPYNCNGTGI